MLVRRPRVARRKLVRRRVARKPAVRPLTAAIQKVVNRNLETKMASFYSPDPQYQQGVTADGSFAKVGSNAQNMAIISNVTDIKRMLPLIPLGNSVASRIGDSIKPVRLSTKIHISLNPGLMSQMFLGTTTATYIGSTILGRQSGTPTADYGFPINDLTVVVYCLTHKTLKDYTSLAAQNNFGELLDVGQGSATSFGTQVPGTSTYLSYPWHADMKVNTSKYNVIKKFTADIRKDMIVTANPGTDPTDIVVNGNSHKYAAEFTCTLTEKELPASLKYDPQQPGSSLNDPTNFAPFWVVGCYNKAYFTTKLSPIACSWVSTLYYKDA